MSESEPHFQLSGDIEHYLSALSKLYAREGDHQKQEIIVNAQIRIQEMWTSDNWNGATYGHALFLTIPENLYLNVVKERSDIQSDIKADLNKMHNVLGEFIAEVFLEMEKVQDRDWRRESGALHSRQRVITFTEAQRIWTDDCYRVFFSHKAEVKKESANLKEQLTPFGISCFVAHTDIYPTKEWQSEIENALASMDAFVALLTTDFHESDWTDQEVGFALGRGVPLIAVKLGRDPYGFIGKFQALPCDWADAPLALVKLLIRQPRMLDAYINAVTKCNSFEQGNTISQVLSFIKTLSEEQTEKLLSAFNSNPQLQGSYGFNGSWSSTFGPGLATHLTRITGKRFEMGSSGLLKLSKR